MPMSNAHTTCRPRSNGRLTRRDVMRRALSAAVGARVAPAVWAQTSAPLAWAPLIDHVQINSDDVRRSTDFYRSVLGLQLLRTGPANEPACCPDESAFFGVGSRLILAIRKRAGRN